MTLLESITHRLMGPPEMHKGELRWTCPKCGSRGFHVRPHRPPFKDRWSCWTCAAWGDELDLLAHFFPHETYPKRVERLDGLREQYERDATIEPLFTWGMGERYTMGSEQSRGPRNDRRDLDLAWADFMADLKELELGRTFGLQLLTQFKQRCDANNVSMERLLQYWRDFENWCHESEQRHLAECEECRVARGLEPLTAKKAGRRNGKAKAKVRV